MKSVSGKTLADNRKAFHDYFVEERYEAGVALLGWEVKSIRAGKAQLRDSYVVPRRGEMFLINCHISPMLQASTHVDADPSRSRKLLLNAAEIRRLIGKVKEERATLIPLNIHLSRGKIKIEIGLARGKKKHDKRRDIREKEWQRDKQRILKAVASKNHGKS